MQKGGRRGGCTFCTYCTAAKKGDKSVNLDYLYRNEPALENVMDKALTQRRGNIGQRYAAYDNAKEAAFRLVGFGARNENLRNHRAYEVFVIALAEGLNL